MLIRFVHSRNDAVAFLDSFSYHLAIKDAAMPTKAVLPSCPSHDPGIDGATGFSL